jgi:hypothetical protein
MEVVVAMVELLALQIVLMVAVVVDNLVREIKAQLETHTLGVVDLILCHGLEIMQVQNSLLTLSLIMR